MKRKKKLFVLIPLALIAAGLIFFFADAANGYRAGDAAQQAMQGSDTVSVKKMDGGWLFDGPSEEKAVIFYPGAKVETTAYAPILEGIAEEGAADVFLVEMPFHYAFFGINRAKAILANYSYDEWYMAGHSLGAAMAASFAADHTDEISGDILLAGYPPKSLKTDGFRLLSVYGTQDGHTDMLAKGKENRPDDDTEVVISGGNHAQFGDYGVQKGDGKARISAQDQWQQTIRAVCDFLRS